MRRHPRDRGRVGGFVLAEAIALMAIVALAAALLLVASHDNRRRSMLAGSIDNLRQIGAAYFSFAADNDDRIASFTWQPGVTYYADDGYAFPPATNYTEAAANQAVAIIRRRAGRGDIGRITGWIPYIFYNHLVLVDYFQDDLPARVLASPGDLNRLAWQRNHHQITALLGWPVESASLRWPYSSSYQIAPAAVSPDAAVWPVTTIAQVDTHSSFSIPIDEQTVLGNRHLREVSFPSRKVLVFESDQRFFGAPEVYFAYDRARVPNLFADGSASVRLGARINSGFRPNQPTDPLPTRMRYEPSTTWETPTLSGNAGDYVHGNQRWCRSGLRGRDTGGPEVPWQ